MTAWIAFLAVAYVVLSIAYWLESKRWRRDEEMLGGRLLDAKTRARVAEHSLAASIGARSQDLATYQAKVHRVRQDAMKRVEAIVEAHTAYAVRGEAPGQYRVTVIVQRPLIDELLPSERAVAVDTLSREIAGHIADGVRSAHRTLDLQHGVAR